MAFNDHGNAFKSEDFEPDYAPPPRFTVHSHSAMVSRHAYEMKVEASDAAIHANRLVRLAEQGFAKEALQNQELSECMDACMKALSDAIAKFSKEPPIAQPEMEDA